MEDDNMDPLIQKRSRERIFLGYGLLETLSIICFVIINGAYKSIVNFWTIPRKMMQIEGVVKSSRYIDSSNMEVKFEDGRTYRLSYSNIIPVQDGKYNTIFLEDFWGFGKDKWEISKIKVLDEPKHKQGIGVARPLN